MICLYGVSVYYFYVLYIFFYLPSIYTYIFVGVVGCCIIQRLSNGAIEPDSDVARVIELQNTVDKQVSCYHYCLVFCFIYILLVYLVDEFK